jgi:23S rRNA pseudouridine1911/1915/1917 synthase
VAFARLTVGGESRRIDRFLRDELGGGVGRRGVAALIGAGAVRVNGRVAVKSTLVAAGDEVTVAATGEAPAALQPLPMPLAIVYCDEQLVAVDKPPGVPSIAGRSGAASLAAGLVHRFPEMAAIDPARAAGLVHRLDTGTSGLLVAARTPFAYHRLRDAFAAKTIVKEYVAVVHGRIATNGVVTAPLARRRRSRKRMVVAESNTGWHAATEYRPLSTAGELTLVQLRMRTGVTHQLRVHMAHLGHPVVGDRRYGSASDTASTAARAASTGARAHVAAANAMSDAAWHYLHALRIEAEHGELLHAIATSFPAHWRPLFERLGWPTDLPDAW